MLGDGAYGPGPILLTGRGWLNQNVIDYYTDWAALGRPSYAVGGTTAIPNVVFREFLDLWNMPQ